MSFEAAKIVVLGESPLFVKLFPLLLLVHSVFGKTALVTGACNI
jgi:hypothetical protein